MSSSPVPPPPATPPDNTPHDLGHLPMTEEMDSAKWTLPPVIPVLIAFLAVGAIVALLLWRMKPQPTVEGGIVRVTSATVEQSESVITFAVIHLRVKNLHEKPLYIKSITAQVKTSQGEHSDEASPATDHARYLQAVSTLKEHQIAPIKPDDRINQNQEQTGMIMVAFPITNEIFDAREQLTVMVELFDRARLVLREK